MAEEKTEEDDEEEGGEANVKGKGEKKTPSRSKPTKSKHNKRGKRNKGNNNDIDAILKELDSSPHSADQHTTSHTVTKADLSLWSADIRYLDPLFERKKIFGKSTVNTALQDMRAAEADGGMEGGGGERRDVKEAE